MTGQLIATCDRELKAGAAPEWVHLFPPGRMFARDGREFILANPQAVVLAFEKGGIDLPIDYNHENDRKDPSRAGPIPAAGWIKELAVRGDGLWGRVEWTAKARELIGNREYRFLSPTFYIDAKTNAIMQLKGAGLVHNPALHPTALASEETDMDDAAALRTSLVEALGLPADTADAELFSAARRVIEEMRRAPGGKTHAETAALAASGTTPDPAKFVPIATVQAMLTERRSERAAASEERVKSKVSKALADGLLTPAMAAWATDLCRADEASFDRFLAESGPVFAHFGKRIVPTGAPPSYTAVAASAEEEALCAQLGLKPGSLAD